MTRFRQWELACPLNASASDPRNIKVELHNVKDDEEKPSAKPAAKEDAAKKTKSAQDQRAANSPVCKYLYFFSLSCCYNRILDAHLELLLGVSVSSS